MVRFTRTGLEGLINQAVHDIVEDRKKDPAKEESPEVEATQIQSQEEQKEITGSITYGTNSDTRRMLFNGSYHTFTANSSNQMQCTCCPEPILTKAIDIKDDFSVKKEDYSASTTTSSYTDLTKPRKSTTLY